MSWFPVLPPSGAPTPVPCGESSASCGGSPGSSVSCGELPSGAPSLSGSSGRRRGRRWCAGWGALALVDKDVEVVCIADEPQTSAFEFLVQFVKVENRIISSYFYTKINIHNMIMK